MIKIKAAFIILLLTVFFGFIYQTNSIKVIDGDTMVIDGETLRLYNIDCIEIEQHPFSLKTKDYVEYLIEGSNVTYKSLSKDRYGRTISIVYIDGQDLSLLLVKEGYAFVYDKYCNDPVFYKAEKMAIENRLGVWKYKLQEPWIWRRYN